MNSNLLVTFKYIYFSFNIKKLIDNFFLMGTRIPMRTRKEAKYSVCGAEMRMGWKFPIGAGMGINPSTLLRPTPMSTLFKALQEFESTLFQKCLFFKIPQKFKLILHKNLFILYYCIMQMKARKRKPTSDKGKRPSIFKSSPWHNGLL